jgi:F420-dependent oxidoreductase-like protein
MKLGLHLSNFTFPGGAATLADDISRVAVAAEDTGFSKLAVMDHLWQIHMIGPAEDEMLEAYTTLGYLAARTNQIELLTWVTAVIYREPGMLAKMVTTLDVLSKGRAWLGIGAAWNEDESNGLGLPFPGTSERFERLEEAVQIFIQMCSDDESAYNGTHYKLGRTLNSPQALRRPHPPILIGGSGEKKTLRMVAQYAQACNIFPGPELGHKLDVLRQHCANLGTDYDAIEKTVIGVLDPSDSKNIDEFLETARGWSELGIDYVHVSVADVSSITPLETIGEKVIPELAVL